MSWLLLIQLIPLIIKLMEIAEKASADGEGEEKRKFVVDGIVTVIEAMPAISSGGQKETWDKLNLLIVPIKKLVDMLAGLLFPHK